MVDIASQKDERGIYLDEVGVTGLEMPIRVRDKENEWQHTIGMFDVFVYLPPDERGTHMSRLVETVYKFKDDISQEGLKNMVTYLCSRLGTNNGIVRVKFPYTVTRVSPISKLHSLMVYRGRFTAIINNGFNFQLGVDVGVGTYCPCGKAETSGKATHAQRGQIKVDIKTEPTAWIWLETLIEIAEQSGSAPLYDRLKRPDEAHVIMQGFNNPKFTEDCTREVATKLNQLAGVKGYMISTVNQENIHCHQAYSKKYFNWQRE